MVIDHNAAGADFGDARYVVPGSPATPALVYFLYQAFSVDLLVEPARLLFFGVASDFGFFRFIKQKAGDMLRLAARLADFGTLPADIFARTVVRAWKLDDGLLAWLVPAESTWAAESWLRRLPWRRELT